MNLDPAMERHLSFGLGLVFLVFGFPALLARGIGLHRLRKRFPAMDGDSIQRSFHWVSTEVEGAGSWGSGQMPFNYHLGMRALHISAPFPFRLGARGKASVPWPQMRLVSRSHREKSRWLESIPLVGAALIRAEFKAGDYPATFTITGRCARNLLEYLDHAPTL